MLSQWKLFDNLRRSLVPVALALLLMLGWTVLLSAWFWTAVVLVILLVPSAIAALGDLADKPAEMPVRQHLAAVLRGARRHVLQALLSLAFLPYESFYSLDAIVRTIWRMLITHRRLLEWKPFSEVDLVLEQRDGTDLLASYRAMGIAPAIAAAVWIDVSLTRPAVLAVAGPILLLWGVSPAIAWWLSRPLVRRSTRLSVDQTKFLRNLARRTWAYFETYVGPDDNWLPPDNVQEHPALKVAHRTSPTNMGLALLANLTAHDFGYLSTGQLVKRTTYALRTMESLDRHKGHFYNWYDSQTLLPLPPLYVSSVDSGNLAAHLLTLRPGLTALLDAPIINRRWFDGLCDTFSILVDTAGRDPPATVAQFAPFETALALAAAARPVTLVDAWVQVEQLAASAADVATRFTASHPENADSEASFWARALAGQCAELRDELIFSRHG